MNMRYGAIAVMLLLMFAGRTAEASEYLRNDTFIRIAHELKPSVVRIAIKTGGKKSAGSGILIDETRVLTNHHVAADAAEITIEFMNGQKIAARIAGGDAESDLAVLKPFGENARFPGTPARLGDSSSLPVGSIVVAIGNSLDLGITVSHGIISAIGRTLPMKDGDTLHVMPIDMLQTNADITTGNSGGALVNLDGEVIGINTMIIARVGVSGIGFAIPINYAKDMLDILASGKQIGRGWIGVGVDIPDHEDIAIRKLPAEPGVIVTKVEFGGPAFASGLKPFDFITHVNGKSVYSPENFRWHVRNALSPLTLTFWRNGVQHVVNVPVKDMPANP